MNKKGLELFSAMISVFTLIALCFAAYSLIFNPKFSGQERIIGEKAFAIFDLDQQADYQKFLVEEGIKYASYNALAEFGKKGGDCGDWSLCKPNLDKFNDYFKKEYFKVLKNAGVRLEERENYTSNIKVNDNFFVINIEAKEKAWFSGSGVYYWMKYEPFSKEIDYDLNIYDELYNKLYTLRANKKIETLSLEKCPSKEELLVDNIECDDSSDKIYIKFEKTQQLMFVNPIIKFKVVKLGKLSEQK